MGDGDMSTTTTMVHVRIDEHIKASAAKTLATMGLSISDAVRVFLTRVVLDKQIPFDIKVPNERTRAALAEAERIVKKRSARFSSGEALFDVLKKQTHR